MEKHCELICNLKNNATKFKDKIAFIELMGQNETNKINYFDLYGKVIILGKRFLDLGLKSKICVLFFHQELISLLL